MTSEFSLQVDEFVMPLPRAPLNPYRFFLTGKEFFIMKLARGLHIPSILKHSQIPMEMQMNNPQIELSAPN